MARWQITNASLFNGEFDFESASGVLIDGGKIDSVIREDSVQDDIATVNLHGLALFPGFINSHDSLLATYHPVQGKNFPHLNWLSWDNEVKASQEFRDRMLLDPETLYRLGAYKNIISGVTTVVDHIPEFVRKPFEKELPVNLLTDYGIAHSVCSYALNWGEGIEKEHKKAVQKKLPFILHIAEGFDDESRQSLERLHESGALSSATVLVHGLSLSETDLDLISEAGASIVWCPVSNEFLYENTLPVAGILERGIPLSIGTDSAMAGGGLFIDNLNSARQQIENAGFDSSPVWSMGTSIPAYMFKMKKKGTLSRGADADLVILSKYPANLAGEPAGLEDIYLVVRNGLPVYGDVALESVFDELKVKFDRVSVGGSRKLVQSGLIALLDSVYSMTGADEYSFLPVVI